MTETVSELEALLKQRTRELEICEERLRTLTRLEAAAQMFPLIEERFHAIFRNLSAGMALTFPNGSFIEVNPAFCSFLGYSADELMKLTVEDITHPDDRAETRRRRVEAFTGQARSFTLEKRYLRKDGTTVWGHISANWFYDEVGKPVYSVALVQDITDRKRTEEALRQSEERFRSMFEHTNAGMVLISPDGNFIDANPAFCTFLGYSREELLKLHIMDITHPDDHEETNRRLGEAKAGFRNTFNRGKRYLCQDGKTVWGQGTSTWFFDGEGNPSYAVAIIQDITEQKRTEEVLLESEKSLRHAISEAPFPVMIHAEDGEILQMSRVWTELTGYTRHDIQTVAEWTERAFDDRKETARAEIGMLYRLKERKKGGEYIITTASGTKLVWDFSSAPLGRLPDGRRLVLSMAVDVTDRKLMEEKIEILNTNLTCRATELETANLELEAFNYTVSHDLRKPLTNINSYCQVIEELCGEKLDEQCRGYVRQIHDGTLRMNRLIDILLNFSRLTQVKIQRQPVDLSELAKCITAGLTLTEPQRPVTFAIGEKVGGDGDANLLRVVLENLFGNAWKYTAKKEAAVIEFGVTELEGESVYFVRDNGVGFDMAYADKLFVPFQRLPGTGEFQGHGIGLATVHRIIKRHGGKVWAEGEPGGGATFYFTLPAAKPSSAN